VLGLGDGLKFQVFSDIMSAQQDAPPPPPSPPGAHQPPPPGVYQPPPPPGFQQVAPPAVPQQPPLVGGGAQLPPQAPQQGGLGYVAYPQGQGFGGGHMNWGGMGFMPGQFAVNGHGMQNVNLNANYALNAANLAEQQARLATQNCNNLAKSFVKTERWSRDLKIVQETAKYKSPADKKAVEYLMEENFDLKEMHSALNLITPDDPAQPIVTAANCHVVESTIKFMVDHLQMRLRKRTFEEESYRIARESTFGWRTEKKFRKDPIFIEDNFDDDSLWYQKPELSKEKKLEKLRIAERDVKFEMTNMRKMQQEQFRPEGSGQFGFQARQQHQNQFYYQQRQNQSHSHQHQNQSHSHQNQFYSQSRQMPYGRQDNRKCNACGEIGHISRYCSVKAQQQNFVPPVRVGQQQGQHQSGGN
jgi:hypothetical protein